MNPVIQTEGLAKRCAAGGLVEALQPWQGVSPFDQALAGGPLGGGVLWVPAALPVFDRRDITVH